MRVEIWCGTTVSHLHGSQPNMSLVGVTTRAVVAVADIVVRWSVDVELGRWRRRYGRRTFRTARDGVRDIVDASLRYRRIYCSEGKRQSLLERCG